MATKTEDVNPTSEPKSTEDKMTRDISPTGGSSDGEGGERTAREKLKKTSIAGLQQSSAGKADVEPTNAPHGEPIAVDPVSENTNKNGNLRGRPSKKRSFEDLLKDDPNASIANGSIGPPPPKHGHHKRMRSRDLSNGDQYPEFVKTEEQFGLSEEEKDVDAQKTPGGPGILVEAPSPEEIEADQKQDATEENDGEHGLASTTSATQPLQQTTLSSAAQEAKPDESAKPEISPGSGFANTSSASPFGAVKPPTPSSAEPAIPTTTTTTSSSAFASSGLSAFASSEKSPFGAAGSTSSTGGFGGGNSSGFGGAGGGFGSASGFPSASPFSANKPSGFGAAGGFGSTGGFGSGFGGKPAGGLSSFAGPSGGAGTFGKGKPFGTAKNEAEEGSDADDDADNQTQPEEEVQPDSRFHEQDLETGEENEETIFSCRAKLYHFEKEWKERGVGTFKINIRYEEKNLDEDEQDPDPESGDVYSHMERKARLIMRTDGVHKVVLNSPVFKGMNVGTQTGEEPSGKTMFLTGLEDGKPRGFQIKIGKEETLRELYHRIQELKEES